MAETITYVGTVKTLEEKKNGWFCVHIAVPGKNYPIKADTKRENVLAKAREVRDAGTVATFEVEEWDSDNTNPNTGNPYTERRLNAITEGAQAAPTTVQGPQGQQIEAHHEQIHPADKDRLISRQVALKAAAQVYMGKGGLEFEDGGPNDVPLAVMKAARRFERDLYRDIDPVPSSAAQTPPQQDSQSAENREGWDEYHDQHPVDDDIPF